MSTITFPGQLEHVHRPGSPSGSSASTHDGGSQFFASFVDAGAGSGFQMNPLSQHPPRTPRTSMAASSHHTTHARTHSHSHSLSHSHAGLYGSSVYDPQDEKQEEEDERTDGGYSMNDGSVAGAVDVDEDETGKLRYAESRVRPEDVWREIVKTSNGRDKAFKLLQYTIRLYLLFHTKISASRLFRARAQGPWAAAFVQRLRATQSGFSFSRRTLLLFSWLAPLTALTAERAVPYSAELSSKQKQQEQEQSNPGSPRRPFLQTLIEAPPPVLLELVQAVADDLHTFSLLGLLGKRFGARAGRFSDWCWLLATLVGLVENGVERGMIVSLQRDVEGRLYRESLSGGATARSRGAASRIDERELARLRRQDWWLQATRAKLLMDLVFVSYGVFRLRRWKETAKTFAGLAAALLSSAKLYDRHRAELTKKLANTL